jgi:pyruvate dehydrogenase E2 component (dihydrolipoamide acetyltransferase)
MDRVSFSNCERPFDLEMTKRIKMPKYGLQQDEGTVVRWNKQVGDEIAEGEILCEVETDKALFDFEATDKGVLRKILCEEGVSVPVLSDIAIITDTADEAIMSFGGDGKAQPDTTTTAPSAATAGPITEASSVPHEPSTDSAPTTRVRSSPAGRKLARSLGVDLETVTGTGPNGRITTEDVQQAADAASSSPTSVANGEPLSRMRKAIGKAMVAAKQTIPHFYLSIDVDATDCEAAWKAAAESDRPDLTLTDIIVKAAADTLSAYRILNARLESNHILYNDHVHVGLAVGTDGGLLVPVIDSADAKSLSEITTTRSQIVTAARQGKLASDTPATVTISNLGMFGIREFSAIINPPECAALAIGSIRDEVKPGPDSAGFIVRRVMTVTLSADHRLVDGLICSGYLQDLKSKLENLSWL